MHSSDRPAIMHSPPRGEMPVPDAELPVRLPEVEAMLTSEKPTEALFRAGWTAYRAGRSP